MRRYFRSISSSSGTLARLAASALLLVPYVPSAQATPLVATVASRSSHGVRNAARWTRARGLASLRAQATAPALPPAPGAALPWEPGFGVYKGQADLATGNLLLTQPVTSWTALGPGVSLTFAYNSEGTRAGALGAHWTHSYEARIVGASPAVLVRGDGREVPYVLSNGAYVAPAGFWETLVRAGDGTWTLTFKDGSTQRFDASGRLTALADANGNATTLTYAGSNLAQITDAVGRSLVLSYTGGQLTGATDPEGRVWSFGYNASGALSSVSDPTVDGAPMTTLFAYDSTGLVSGVTNRLGKTWSYAYGSSGTFYSVTDPSGNGAGTVTTVPTSLDTKGYSASRTGTTSSASATPDAVASTYPTDTVATPYVQDAGGNAHEYGVDSQGRTTAERDGSGNQTNYAWDAANDRTKVVAPDGATSTVSFDARGNVTSVTDPTNRTVNRICDARNNPTSVTDGAGKTTTCTYDARNNQLTTTDPTGRTETRGYNANGTLAMVTDGAGKTTAYGYSPEGDATSVTDALGNTSNYTYTLGRVVSRTDPMGRQTAYAYDAMKRLTTVDYPQSVDQSFAYDKEGRMTSSVDGTGTRTYSYDSLGRKIQQVDPRGTTTASYDGASRLTGQTDPTGRQISYAYDGDGVMTGLSDPSSSATYSFDSRHRLTSVASSDGITSTYVYDAASRPTSLVHRSSSGATIASYAASYDAVGRLTQSVEGPTTATTAYTYDDASRLLTENRTGASPYASTYSYDVRGLRATALRSENGVTSHNGTYTYDDAGRLTNVADNVATSGLGGAYAWNADGTLASMPANGYRRVLSYDEDGRLTGIAKLQGGATTPLYQYGYGCDGNRRWRKDLAGGVWDWYPCGVACCAGDLVSLRSTDGGASWTTLKSYLSGSSKVRYGSSYSLPTLTSDIDTEVSSNGVTIGSRVRDALGVVRSGAVLTQAPEAYCVEIDDTMLASARAMVALPACGGQRPLDDLIECAKKCIGKKGQAQVTCIGKCLGNKQIDRTLDDLFCRYSPDECPNGKPPKCGKDSDTDQLQRCCDLTYYKCMATTSPSAWAKCVTSQKACYIKAALRS